MMAHSPSGPVCSTGNFSLPASGAESALAWKITAQFCLGAHPCMFNASALLMPALSADYVRDLLYARLQWMHNRNNLKGVNLFHSRDAVQ